MQTITITEDQIKAGRVRDMIGGIDYGISTLTHYGHRPFAVQPGTFPVVKTQTVGSTTWITFWADRLNQRQLIA